MLEKEDESLIYSRSIDSIGVVTWYMTYSNRDLRGHCIKQGSINRERPNVLKASGDILQDSNSGFVFMSNIAAGGEPASNGYDNNDDTIAHNIGKEELSAVLGIPLAEIVQAESNEVESKQCR